MADTVKLHVTVHIDYDNPDYDTGYTVEQWNSFHSVKRHQVKQDAWDAAAQSDDGGIWPVTDGASRD